MNAALLDVVLLACLDRIAEAKAAGGTAQDARRALAAERKNAAAYAESLFSTILPPPPPEPAPMPSVRSYEPGTKTWGDIAQTAVETVRPSRGGR